MAERLWWERSDLCYQDGDLHFAGRNLFSLAGSHQTPSFFYSPERVRQNLKRIDTALSEKALSHRIFYAVKANRSVPLLTWLKTTGLCGIDACSPEECNLAFFCGFLPEEISYTATSVSDEDLDFLARHPGILVNCDSISMIRRLGRRCPGRRIGIRINPAMGVGYGDVDVLQYSGDKTTKFGIYREQFDEALNVADSCGLKVSGIHFHTGCGYLNRQLDRWEQILTGCLRFIEKVPDLEYINVGGGLGVPHTKDDTPLDTAAWAGILKKVFGHTGALIAVEPGDYIIKDAGLLILQANMVEMKRETRFIGVNGGFNLAVEPFFYSLPCEPVPCRLTGSVETVFRPELTEPVTIAGNINEALDVWAENIPFPPVEEGDYIVMLNAGGYAASMSSNHCMRGSFREFLLF